MSIGGIQKIKEMKLTFIQSATVVIEHENVKILCDPWLTDGEYYGSWAHYPPYDFKPFRFDDIDYIYISHIHPDHCSAKTLSSLKKDTPVLIHDFPTKFLKNNIENMGFQVLELPHNKRIHLKNNLYINILAADNCDPTICGRLFACNFEPSKFGTNQIDTMCVVDNKEEVIVNTNDCPFEIAQSVSSKVKDSYKNIDLLLVGYSGASAYPHCYELSYEEMELESKKKKQLRLTDAKKYIELFKPKYFLPFAGRYTLCGKLYQLNSHRGEPELEEAYDYLITQIDQNHKGILLNPDSSFDITTGNSSEHYARINLNEKYGYIEKILSKRKFDYESGSEPTTKELMQLIPCSYERFEQHRKKLGFQSDTTILLEISDKDLLALSCKGDGYKVIPKEDENNFRKYLKLSLDRRLLRWILQGPQKAHWNNADIGSHIRWKRVPNIYEMGIYYCLNFFHS